MAVGVQGGRELELAAGSWGRAGEPALVQRVLGGQPGQVHPVGFRDGPALALVARGAAGHPEAQIPLRLCGSAGSAPVSRSAPRAAPPPPLFCLLS